VSIININNLKEGQIIKNYKELCNILDIKICNGNSKIKQLEELKIYCNYEREGNKYMIKEVYKNPTITINDLLKTKNSKYIKLLANIIVEYLYNNPKDIKEMPLIKLFTVLGITNTNYKDANYYRKELSQLYNIQLASIYYFYSNTRNEFKRVIERCLNNLRDRRVLNWNRCIIIIDKENKSIYKADEKFQKEIIDMEKQALQSLQYNSMCDLMKNKKDLKKFNDILEKEVGYSYYYAYDLIIGEIALKIEYGNIQKNKNELNKLMINKSKNMFDKTRYLPFQNDYDILINTLINTENTQELKELLKDKREENMQNFIEESIYEKLKHDKNLKDIKSKYIDIYENIEADKL
jgi:hypothetical protein